jgi:hypothetical protein
MSKIKNVNIQLDHDKKREKKIIDLLEKVKKEDGTSHKEYIISALENRNDAILNELREIKQLILFLTSSSSKLSPELELSSKVNRIRKISALDDDISKDDINNF